jgi:hypothetical protein
MSVPCFHPIGHPTTKDRCQAMMYGSMPHKAALTTLYSTPPPSSCIPSCFHDMNYGHPAIGQSRLLRDLDRLLSQKRANSIKETHRTTLITNVPCHSFSKVKSRPLLPFPYGTRSYSYSRSVTVVGCTRYAGSFFSVFLAWFSVFTSRMQSLPSDSTEAPTCQAKPQCSVIRSKHTRNPRHSETVSR